MIKSPYFFYLYLTMIELTNKEKQLIISGLYGILNEIEWSIQFPYIDDNQTEEEYFTYYNNKKQVVKQLLEKLS